MSWWHPHTYSPCKLRQMVMLWAGLTAKELHHFTPAHKVAYWLLRLRDERRGARGLKWAISTGEAGLPATPLLSSLQLLPPLFSRASCPLLSPISNLHGASLEQVLHLCVQRTPADCLFNTAGPTHGLQALSVLSAQHGGERQEPESFSRAESRLCQTAGDGPNQKGPLPGVPTQPHLPVTTNSVPLGPLPCPLPQAKDSNSSKLFKAQLSTCLNTSHFYINDIKVTTNLLYQSATAPWALPRDLSTASYEVHQSTQISEYQWPGNQVI